MDEADADGEVVEAVDGVTLRKRFEEAEFHQPAVVYEFDSDRDEVVRVRLIETIPDALAPENIGFLGSSMDRTWEIKGPKLVFENDLEANESFTTACAARGESADAIADLLGEPDVFEVSPSVAESQDESAMLTRSADGVETAEPGTSPGSADEDDVASTASREEADVISPENREEDDAISSESRDEDDSASNETREPVVEQFVDELRAGEVSDDSVEFLRDELGAARPPRSVETRLKQLQTDLSDVRAYTNALEAFIDEHGTADDIVGRLERRLESVEGGLASLDETVADHGTDLDRLQVDLDDLEAEVDALGRELRDTTDHFEEIRADIDRVDDRLPADLEERLADLEAELADVSRFTNSLRSAFED